LEVVSKPQIVDEHMVIQNYGFGFRFEYFKIKNQIKQNLQTG